MLRMRVLPAGFIAPCLPTKAPQPPSGAVWLHEIKHDGFRVIARKEGPRVTLYSRPGNDLTDRFPLIVEALARLRASGRSPDWLKMKNPEAPAVKREAEEDAWMY
jgi:ATP-dependent DNA ligase